MNISLTPELEKFVSKEVKSGLYRSASEVIRAGLRRLKEDKERNPRYEASSVEELEEKLAEGVEELDRGAGISGTQVFEEIEKQSSGLRRGKK